MKRYWVLLWCLSGVWPGLLLAQPTAGRVVWPTHFTYAGAMRLPPGAFNMLYNDVGSVVSFAPGTPGSLFIKNGSSASCYSQVSIPTLNAGNTTLGSLPTASSLKSCSVRNYKGFTTADVCSGTCSFPSPEPGQVMVSGSKLIVMEYVFYDGAPNQTASYFWKDSTDLAASDVHGPITLTGMPTVRYTSGVLFPIPTAWRSSFGSRDTFIGNCCLSIIGSTSSGPALAVTTASNMTAVTSGSVSTTPVLYYQYSTHDTLGVWNSGSNTNITIYNTCAALGGTCSGTTCVGSVSNKGKCPAANGCGLGTGGPATCGPGTKGDATGPWIWNNANANAMVGYRGMVALDGTRSVLAFNYQGVGTYEYGEGVSNPSLDGSLSCVPVCVYDPDEVGDKGDHAYPYRLQIMAFDLNDLVAVYAGTKNPWDVIPYAVWYPTLTFTPSYNDWFGVAWDPALRRLYVYVPNADTSNPPLGVVEVYTVADLSSGGDSLAPAAPGNVRVVHP